MGREERDGRAGLTLQLDNAIASIEIGRLALNAYLEPLACDARLLNRLEVVFEEIVSNIVRHGGGAGRILVRAEFLAEREGGGPAVRLTVEDDGAAFDPLHLPEPEMTARLEDAQLGGLGIPLIRRLSRTVSYARVGAGQSALNRLVAMVAG